MIKLGIFISMTFTLFMFFYAVLATTTEKWRTILINVFLFVDALLISYLVTELIFLNLGVKG